MYVSKISVLIWIGFLHYTHVKFPSWYLQSVHLFLFRRTLQLILMCPSRPYPVHVVGFSHVLLTIVFSVTCIFLLILNSLPVSVVFEFFLT